MEEMKTLSHTIRIVLTLILVCFAYKETGIFTAICLFLIFVGIEALSFTIKGIWGALELLAVIQKAKAGFDK